jgi:hypothetical protein
MKDLTSLNVGDGNTLISSAKDDGCGGNVPRKREASISTQKNHQDCLSLSHAGATSPNVMNPLLHKSSGR